MTTTVAERDRVVGTGGIVSEPSVQHFAPSSSLRRPPTVFGQRSSWEVVERGYAVACRAVGYALEAVAVPDAVAALVAEEDRDALEMAHDYLACTPFAVARSQQVAALFLLEDALYTLDYADRRRGAAWNAMRRARQRLCGWVNRIIRWRRHSI